MQRKLKSMKNFVNKWIRISRAFAAPQNLMPSIMTVVLGIGVGTFSLQAGWGMCLISLLLGILAVIAVCLVHLGGNMLDDYFDYKYDLLDYRKDLRKEGETAYTDKYTYLLDGTLTLAGLRRGITAFLGIAILFGLIIFWFRGWTVVLIAALAAFLCFFYSAPPFKLGFHGLGELVIGLCFGPCLMCGVWESTTGALLSYEDGFHAITPFTDGLAATFSWSTVTESFAHVNGFCWYILALGLAIGLFVTNILYTHSFLERHVDSVSHKKTLAVVLKSDKLGLMAYAFFAFTPFALVIAFVGLGYIHWAYLFVCLMLPQAIWVMWAMMMFSKGVDVPTESPHKWLGPMENWDKIEPANRYYLMRWYTMRNVNTGFCLILIVVKIVLLIFNS